MAEPGTEAQPAISWSEIIATQLRSGPGPGMGEFDLTPVFQHFKDSLKGRNDRALKILTDQIQMVANKREVFVNTRFPPLLHTNDFPLRPGVLKSHAVLTFMSDPTIAAKIDGMKTPDGQLLAVRTTEPDGTKLVSIWNPETKSRDVYEELHAERGDTMIQYSAFYDRTNDRLTINFGGTDFANAEDIKNAAQATSGGTDMRMTAVKGLLDKTMSAFNKRYPGKIKTVPVDIYAHSAGANGVALANYYLQREHHVAPRAQVMFDPFGARNSFEHVAQLIADAEGGGRSPNDVLYDLTRNTVSYKVRGGSFIDHLGKVFDPVNDIGPGNPAATVGRVEHLGIKGNTLTAHFGKAWVEYFSATEMEELKAGEKKKEGPLVAQGPQRDM